MNQEGTKRKLAAILSADVKEYSRLMSQDERGTIRTLTAYKEAMSSLIEEYKGRVVDAPGDNLLAEFGSVLDAVNCAVEIQRELAERNAELPYSRRMEFRIGINLGDIVEEEGRIYGDGVNIAARVESLAEGGGICISGTVHDHVEGKLGFEYEYLGEQEVKNIEKPVRVYRVLSFPGAAAHRVVKAKSVTEKKWRRAGLVIAALAIGVAGALGIWNVFLRPATPSIEPASIEKMAFPLPDKPSIAVLPFVNMSGDPEQEYIADGVSESIITALCKIPGMFVIARTSTFTYKGKSVRTQQVSEELGVRYVLEGSVQKTGDRIRVTAQLIDAIIGHHLWADRYDRDIEDFFDLLDEIAKKIAIELQVKLTQGDAARMSQKTKNFEAWGYAIQAYGLLLLLDKESTAKARELSEKALKLDPGYGYAWGVVGAAHANEVTMGYSGSPDRSFKLAVEYTDKALKLDETLPCSTGVKGRLHMMQRQFDQAIAAGERAIALGPSYDLPHFHMSYFMRCAGRFEESIALIKKAMRLNPCYPAFYLFTLGTSCFFAGRYEEALEAHEELLERAQKGEYPPLSAHLGLCRVYMELGREEEARAHAAEVLKINPNFSLESMRKRSYYKDPAHSERLLSALRKAGIPEKPPLPLPDKPSIAVLPFKNLSVESEQEFLADGITESIIGTISRVSGLFVIASNSVFTYKGKPVKVQTVSKELGVRNVLEGTVQRIGNRLRVNAQLIDATTGRHLWSEKYDREMKDLFSLQDDISKEILTALRVKLVEGEQARVWAKGTRNLEAYLKYLQAYDHFRSFNKNSMILTRKVCQEAIDLDPNYDAPYTLLGSAHLIDVWMGWGDSPRTSIEKAQAAMQKAITLNPLSDLPHASLGHLFLVQKRFDDAVVEGEKSIALNPNGDLNMVLLSITFNFIRRYEEAITLFKEAQRRNPHCPAWYIHNMGNSYRGLGRWDEAIAEYKRALERDPDHFPALTGMAAACGMAGRLDEGRAVAAEILRINPGFSVEKLRLGFKYKSDAEAVKDGFRKVGLK